MCTIPLTARRFFAILKIAKYLECKLKGDTDMKKVLSLFLLILIPLSVLAGCAEWKPIPDAPENDKISEAESAIAAQISAATVTTPTPSSASRNEFMQSYYVDSPLTLELSACAEKYASSTDASTEFLELWESCNDIRYYPIYGTYFEPTRLFVIAFYNNNAAVNSFVLSIEISDTDYSVTQFEHPSYTSESYHDGKLTSIGPFHRIGITDDLQQATEYGGNATVTGFVFDTQSFAMPYMIATQPNQTALKYWWNTEWTDFRFVDDFSDFEEGRLAFEQYFEKRNEIYASIPIYQWSNKATNQIDFAWFTNTYRDGILNEYENYISIPLLDENCEENQYVLFLLYSHNDLIGEIVLRNNGTEVKEVWRQEATKDTESGKYLPLENSYLTIVNKAKNNGNLTVKGVSFRDGRFFAVGFNSQERVMIYNDETQTLQSVTEYLK